MKYLCLIYVDDQRLARLSDVEYRRLMDECFANDEYQRRAGRVLASEALETVETATTLRHEPAGLSIIDGPFAETREYLGGFVLIDARDLNEALQIAQRIPSGRLGAVEVRPVRDWDRYFAGR
ncbi:YciI family protein [Pseudomonas sp. GD04087]|uniref:YciI family protein n=1 Tax=Pseudomonas TaxID=286 RepID=UPI001F2AE1A3|nr:MULTISPECIES: YciI family protein [Pseudomonas]MDH0292782.1 YciI family protein [Pseudomonas sp. GD04087]MDH1051447.1 YciI family protein [Pseudomonas sp. GD03903]MDH2002431.1 YciI family protein [Pseudomonas sp. GD03691]